MPLQALVDGAAQHVELLLTCQLDEVHSVTRHTDSELRILLGVLHSILKQLTVEHVHVEVMTTIGCEEAVHEVHQVAHLGVRLLAQCCG